MHAQHRGRHLDLLYEQFHDRSAIFPGAALQPSAQPLLQLPELVDDLSLLQRTPLVVLPLREPCLALLLAFVESVSACSKLVERDRSGLVSVHQPADRSLHGSRFAHETSALPLVRLQHRVGLIALRVELGR
ncbi:hypothetical protein [Sorangium sp. So ce394]|uniref:hypothetical protein n=1 Tax=Sorangium sp. So ce394 TaxID=3133310 RepID=UPI003F5B7329